MLETQDFAKWNGTPFFDGVSLKGRHAYVVAGEATFIAYLALDGASEVLRKVQGLPSQLNRFLEQMKVEGAHVSYGGPPFNTNTSGDKPNSDTTKPGRK